MKNKYNQYTDNSIFDKESDNNTSLKESEDTQQNNPNNESPSEKTDNKFCSAVSENSSDLQKITAETENSDSDMPENYSSSEQTKACGGFEKAQHEKQTEKLKAGTIITRCLCVILAIITLTVLSLLSVIFVLERGPSPTARKLFVLSVKETSAAGFLADIFLSDSEIEDILNAQKEAASDSGEHTDTSLINIPEKSESLSGDDTAFEQNDTQSTPETYKPADTFAPESNTVSPDDGIEIIEIKKSTYNGVIIKVSDPTRITLGIPDSYGENAAGLSLSQMIAKFGAVGGINGGGFYDPNGSGTGGIPDGLVISDGELLWGESGSTYNVIGFDENGILHVGSMTAQAALDANIKYACSFGPTLIVNGIPCGSRGGGMNPRTAIGQCADGTVLMAAINGRSLVSLGATYDDVTQLMLEYGAVNTANLDGGSSSLMIYNGNILNQPASMIGERDLPTAFLIK